MPLKSLLGRSTHDRPPRPSKASHEPPSYENSANSNAIGDNDVDSDSGYQLSTSASATSSSSPMAAFRTKFACVSLHMSDRIRLTNFSPSEIEAIQSLIAQSWFKGIQNTRPYDISHEIKLHGYPWYARSGGGDYSSHSSLLAHGINATASNGGKSEKTEGRRLTRKLLEGLFNMGWVLKAAVNVSKKEADKDSLIFRHQQPAPPPCQWITIYFDKADRLRLIDAPQALSQEIINRFGTNRVQKTEHLEQQNVLAGEEETGVFEIKLKGYPWYPSGTKTVQTRLLILMLMDCLEMHGFSLYASFDQDDATNSGDYVCTADTWICNREMGWQPGKPIYHS